MVALPVLIVVVLLLVVRLVLVGVEQFHSSYLFFMWSCVYVNTIPSIHLTLSISHCVHKFIL